MNMKLKAKIYEKFGSQWDFAMAAGIHECQVSRVVRNRRSLPTEERQRWAALLGMDSTELFGKEADHGQES